jgi:glycosyltransferase involved in cell wall biosynthesis
MRILQVITPSRIAGAEIYLSRLSRRLVQSGEEVIVLTKRLPAIEELFAGSEVRVVVGGIGGKLNLLSVFRLCQLIRRERIELINSHLSTASLIVSLAGRMCSVPTVATVHALNNAFCYRFADHLIAVSEAVKSHLIRQGIESEKISVIYPGVDPAEFSPAGKSSEIRHELGIPQDAILVGVVAHLSSKKGHAVLLEAAAKAARSGCECFYLFAGDGTERARLTELAEQLGLARKVVFAGFRRDIRDVIEAMDIVVQPSIEGEGLPASLLQAMSLEKPVIASRLSGIPEIVEDGRTGILVEPGNSESLYRVLMHLVGSAELRAAMGRAGRERVLSEFDMKLSVERTIELYKDLVLRARG